MPPPPLLSMSMAPRSCGCQHARASAVGRRGSGLDVVGESASVLGWVVHCSRKAWPVGRKRGEGGRGEEGGGRGEDEGGKGGVKWAKHTAIAAECARRNAGVGATVWLGAQAGTSKEAFPFPFPFPSPKTKTTPRHHTYVATQVLLVSFFMERAFGSSCGQQQA